MPKVLEFFSDFKQNGRYINVEITEKKERRGNRRFGNQKGGRSRRKDSFRSDGNGRRKERGRDNGGRSPRRSSDFKPQGNSSLALEETVGNNQFVNFKTKQGLLFAMYLEFITFMMKFSYEA
jgi:hypothetical protein